MKHLLGAERSLLHLQHRSVSPEKDANLYTQSCDGGQGSYSRFDMAGGHVIRILIGSPGLCHDTIHDCS